MKLINCGFIMRRTRMNSIKGIYPLEFVWQTEDPFLFCVHHLDFYPAGNEHLGPNASLSGRRIGNDFDMSKEWRMYHGDIIPGFPEHPHRGFETVTVTLEGIIDHFDSLGASGRYGYGDIQWMTAGEGCQHAEMFPLIHKDQPNTLHLFQIWLNLPKKSKFVPANYKMIWKEELVIVKPADGIQFTLIAGQYQGISAIKPTPDSWANDPKNHVDIFLIEMDKGSSFELHCPSDTVNRNMYFYEGTGLEVDGHKIPPMQRIKLANQKIHISTKDERVKLLLLQGEPILEPVVQYGPFVMNTNQEIQQAYVDYQKSQFGGWPWDRSDPVFSSEEGRIAKYKDGTISYPPK
jgi:quercetin 2,3-dioxygenase